MSTGVTGRVLSLASGVLLLFSLAATSDAGDSFTVSLGGGIATSASSWDSRASWSSWAETATLDSKQTPASGTSFQGALGYRFSSHFGLTLAGARTTRDVTASIQAQIPHPLYLNQPRAVSADLSSLTDTELVFHLDLEWRTVTGPIEVSVFAGPTLARVDAGVVQTISVDEAYPYDEATYKSAETAKVTSSNGIGFNAGASAAWLATSHLDIGVEARYLRASVDLTTTGVDTFSLTAGGLQLGARVRLRF